MKRYSLFILFSLFTICAFAFDSTTLRSSVTTATNETIVPGTWYDVVTTTIDVTDINEVLVLASIDMWATGTSTNPSRVASYRLDCNGVQTANPLQRQLERNANYDDHGMGSHLHIFDVSTLSGNIDIKLQHTNTHTGELKKLTTQATLSAIALTTSSSIDLSSDVIQSTSIDRTNSTTFQLVADLNTSAINIPSGTLSGEGAIYVAAAFSTKGLDENSGEATGEWQLQSSPDSLNWTGEGTAVSRTMANRGDEGMVSLVAIVDELDAGDYYFRLVSRSVSDGTPPSIRTLAGAELVAVALNYNHATDGDGYFPHILFNSASNQTNSTNTYSTAATSSFNTVGSAVDVLLHSQFNMVGDEAFNTSYKIDINGNSSYTTAEQERYVSGGSDLGSGVLIGIVENLPANSSYNANLKHKIDEDPASGTLTSSHIILAGFQLTSYPVGEPTLPVELSSFSALATVINNVALTWTVQSETNISGYYLLRGETNSLDSAMLIPSFIPSLNVSQEHSYTFTDNEVENNKTYFYWLKSIEFSNESEYFGPTLVTLGDPNYETTPDILWGTQLQGNFPNPFNPTTEILFSIEKPELVKIDIYNVKGQLVKNLFEEHVSITNQSIKVPWNSRDNLGNAVSSGIYYIKMKAGSYTKTGKMILTK